MQTTGREEGGWRRERRVEEVVERRIRRNRFRARAEDLWHGSGWEKGRKEREEASASMASRGFAVDRGRGNEDPPPRHRAFRYARYVFLPNLNFLIPLFLFVSTPINVKGVCNLS